MTTQLLFINAGLKPTKARIAVLNTIAEASNALSHTEIIESLSTTKEFDRVTIYRVLDWLTENGLVHKISGDNRAWKFHISQPRYTSTTSRQIPSLLDNHHHAHLHCQRCGKIICVHALEPHFAADVLKQYQVTAIDINIKGVCSDCANITPP